ncbi:LysR family transcriptional regulator [Streptomyces sp. NPDC088812]|uniref:LysR family transcriptional regulator n=1 Tax=Streptomyces sp. NPDC088812 TaxID=3365905 RepID=UPI0038249842
MRLSGTRSAVSRRIAALEQRAGGSLFERLPPHPTSPGLPSLPHTRVRDRHTRPVTLPVWAEPQVSRWAS